MSNWIVQTRLTGKVVHVYGADEPGHYDIFPLDTYNHIPQPEVVTQTVREISGVSYLRRFTQDERIAIRGAAAQSAELDDYLKLLDATIAQGGVVDLDDADIVTAVAKLEQYGLIAAGRGAEIRA